MYVLSCFLFVSYRPQYSFHGSNLLSHILLEAVKISLVMSFSSLAHASSIIHISARALHNECPAKHLKPTSIGSQYIFHDICRQCSISSCYSGLYLSFASVRNSSHDTVSFQIMHCFMLSECNIRSDITAMCLRKLTGSVKANYLRKITGFFSLFSVSVS